MSLILSSIIACACGVPKGCAGSGLAFDICILIGLLALLLAGVSWR